MENQTVTRHYPAVFLTGKLPFDNMTFIGEQLFKDKINLNNLDLMKDYSKNGGNVMRITRKSNTGVLTANDWVIKHDETPIVLFTYICCYAHIKIERGDYLVEFWSFDDKNHPLLKISTAINYQCGGKLILFLRGFFYNDCQNVARLNQSYYKEDLTPYYQKCLSMGLIRYENNNDYFCDQDGPTSLWIQKDDISVPCTKKMFPMVIGLI